MTLDCFRGSKGVKGVKEKKERKLSSAITVSNVAAAYLEKCMNSVFA
jgi:hypothetical protein